jgi:succinate dehydrogenase/fumarate reductase flavoprotein subunit
LKYPQITRHDEVFVTKLLVEDSRCVGVVALDIRTGRFDAITAKSVILATGGLGRVYAFTTNGNICTGDGMALAYRAGTGLKDMEMVQFHPTGLPFTGILITEAVRGEGGYLLNNEGDRFLKRYVPNKMELGPRDIISRAMITEFDAGRGFEGPHGKYMHLDVRHLGEKTIDRKLPFMRELGRGRLSDQGRAQPAGAKSRRSARAVREGEDRRLEPDFQHRDHGRAGARLHARGLDRDRVLGAGTRGIARRARARRLSRTGRHEVFEAHDRVPHQHAGAAARLP